MTADDVFRYYRAYKFFYSAKNTSDFEKYTRIKCPPLIEQRDRHFFYRLSQKLNDDTIHGLFIFGFFYHPNAYIAELATPEARLSALVFASRAQNGDTLIQSDLYDLKKRLKCDECHGSGKARGGEAGGDTFECGNCEGTGTDILTWLYGGEGSLPPCVQDLIAGDLPLDLACMLLLVSQKDLGYQWLATLPVDDSGLGTGPWVNRLKKADRLLSFVRPAWRLTAQRVSKEFWHTLADELSTSSFAPFTAQTEASLF
jgi:hypothetical protein